MTTLAADTSRNYVAAGTDHSDLPVIAADIIYEGAAVGNNGAGYHRPLVAGDAFRGFAEQKVDNAAGSAGDKNVRVRTRGHIELTLTSFTITDVGKAVYASDDNVFLLTESTNSFVGRAVRFVATNKALVHFDADNPPLAELVALTDSTGGPTDGTMADTSGALVGVDGTGSNAAPLAGTNTRLGLIDVNFANLTDKVNKLERMIRGV